MYKLHLQRYKEYKPVVLIKALLIACVTIYNLRLLLFSVVLVSGSSALFKCDYFLLKFKDIFIKSAVSKGLRSIDHYLSFSEASTSDLCSETTLFYLFAGRTLILSSYMCIDLENDILYSDLITKISVNVFCVGHWSMLLDLIVRMRATN